ARGGHDGCGLDLTSDQLLRPDDIGRGKVAVVHISYNSWLEAVPAAFAVPNVPGHQDRTRRFHGSTI
ncbi:MAG: hypothetical protein ACNA7J_05750, partial [Wenzhouxiangella sp.]